MFKIEELASQLVRSGRFKQAIPAFYSQMYLAMHYGVIKSSELIALSRELSCLMLVPNVDEAQKLAEKLLKLEMRIPDFIPTVDPQAFEKNVKNSREA